MAIDDICWWVVFGTVSKFSDTTSKEPWTKWRMGSSVAMMQRRRMKKVMKLVSDEFEMRLGGKIWRCLVCFRPLHFPPKPNWCLSPPLFKIWIPYEIYKSIECKNYKSSECIVSPQTRPVLNSCKLQNIWINIWIWKQCKQGRLRTLVSFVTWK